MTLQRPDTVREMKIEAVAKAIEHGATEDDVRRLAPEQGCDSSVIAAGLRRAAKRGFVALALFTLLPLAASAQQVPVPCKVNVQNGTVAELALLPGVGERTAALIAEAKPENLEALDQVKGIGTVKLAWITPHAVFGDAATTCTEKQKRPEPAKDGAQ